MLNRILLLIIVLMLGGVLAFFLLKPGLLKNVMQDAAGVPSNLIFQDELPHKVETWKGSDGASLEAVLVAADDKRVEFRIPATQRVHFLEMSALAKDDQEKIKGRVTKWGIDGVLGYPVSLRTDPWPNGWRIDGRVNLTWNAKKKVWSSEHFDLRNDAKVNQETLETVAGICESVDGALKSLPLPLDWGREAKGRRDIILEPAFKGENKGKLAGFFDGRTGKVHIDTSQLLERDNQSIVFEFDKPKKRQKYDAIVHEVTHQTMVSMLLLDMPAWIPEGMAEYLSAMHFSPGNYQFHTSYSAVRYHINKRVQAERGIKERKLHLYEMNEFMGRRLKKWNEVVQQGDVAGLLQYNMALLLVDYFFHADGKNGEPMRYYLEAVLSGAPEKEAREKHLLRGRSYHDLETAVFNRWKSVGFAIDFESNPRIEKEDFTVDWGAISIMRQNAANRARGK
ncbi:MAG: hypothetical protein GXP30_03605 [Verrucomicrobia bacterium]|nr:hypothetical protein [Verrucomicrobiota bacterium]